MVWRLVLPRFMFFVRSRRTPAQVTERLASGGKQNRGIRYHKMNVPLLSLLAVSVIAWSMFPSFVWGQNAAASATMATATGTVGATPDATPGTQSVGPGQTLSVTADGEATLGTVEEETTAPAAPPKPAGPAGTAELPALIYPDTVSIIRFDTKRVDYEMLKTYLADFIHGAVGSLNSADKYLNNLREEQKEDMKATTADLLDSMQITFADCLWANGVGEFYRIRYEEGGNFCQIIAVPITGVGQDSQMQVMDYLKEHYDPISCFIRFGFLIAVVDHTSATADAEKKDAMAMLTGDFSKTKKKEEKKPEGEEVASTDLTSRQKIRREVLPALRKRFLNPAEGQPAIVDALNTTYGAAVSVIMPNTASVNRWLDFLNKNGLEFNFEPVKQALTTADVFQWASFNISLVGSPRVVILARLNNEQFATQFAALFKTVLGAYQGVLNEKLNAQVAELELPFPSNPFIAMLDPIFKGVQTEAKGKDAAVTLDLNILKENANAFIPLFGGIPSGEQKKKPEPGVEEIDFGEDNALPEVVETPEEPATNSEEMESDTKESEPTQQKDVIDEDDPFA